MSSKGVPLFPEAASTFASNVDSLYLFIVAVSVFFGVAVIIAMVAFGIIFKQKKPGEVGERIEGNLALELLWSIIPTIISMVMFGWGASAFFEMRVPPAETMTVYAVGKQWMWKFQHPDGHAEVNELHVPVGTSVKLTMTSQDVIHDVYIPDFRVKADVLPGRYTHMWFKATQPGRYRLFCAEYCGTNHSGMVGLVVVMERADYQQWLAGGAGTGTMAQTGEKLFKDLSCVTCHKEDTTGRGPTLVGLYGKAVTLDNGDTVEADEAYLRESIVNPRARMVSGFQPIMPTFQGLVSEEGLLQLLEYIKSLKAVPSNATGAPAAPAAAPATPEKK